MTQPTRWIPAVAAPALVGFLFAANIYRAWTQSITADEAFAHNLFLAGPPAKLFNSYDAAHHVFHTLLSKVSISLFGLSEFTLRIASLLGGLLFLATVLRLSRHVFGRGWLMLLSVGLVTLNPFVLDYLSAARGYGLALALFLYALDRSLRFVAGEHLPADLYRIGLALALSVASNLTLLFPAASLAILLLLVFVTERRQFDVAADWFIVPGISIAFLTVALPLTKARMEHFYFGARGLSETMRSLIGASLWHHEDAWLGPRHQQLVGVLSSVLENLLVPIALVLTAVACLLAVVNWFRRGRFGELASTDHFLFLAGGSMLLALALAVTAHKTFGVLYPIARTGLYLIPLFVLVALALWKRIESRRVLSRTIAVPFAALAVLCIFQFAIQFQTNHYAYWRYDAGTKRIVNLIRERHGARPAPNVRIGLSWELEPSINFYRRMYRLDWMAPGTRAGPKGQYDYYVLLAGETDLVKEMGLAVLYTDPVSGAVLAQPPSRGMIE